LRQHGWLARTVTLKVRSAEFVTVTRRATLGQATDRTDVLWHAAAGLFETWARQRPGPVRLVGVGVSQLSDASGRQLGLFEQHDEPRQRQLDQAIDTIRQRFGNDAIARGGPPNESPE
jgi:DNA polymerase-4